MASARSCHLLGRDFVHSHYRAEKISSGSVIGKLGVEVAQKPRESVVQFHGAALRMTDLVCIREEERTLCAPKISRRTFDTIEENCPSIDDLQELQTLPATSPVTSKRLRTMIQSISERRKG